MARHVPPTLNAVPRPVVKCDIDRVYRNTVPRCECIACKLTRAGVDLWPCFNTQNADPKDPPKKP